MELDQFKIEVAKLREKITVLASDAKDEVHEDHIAAEILVRLLEEKPVSEDDISFLKDQSIDLSKVLVLIGLQAVPGSSIAIIVLQKIVEKHGFTLFPDPDRKIPQVP